ncbi:SDR family NAD(P)-dependent oxidoreductase [Elongatibacter sediminis]|uniref:SDR family NAD(P)-dependent oxidoreductase n=1 Tax=Elongatibacter sediminis TaxID=3119006 RepID=A0AAW9RI35_9GAMM
MSPKSSHEVPVARRSRKLCLVVGGTRGIGRALVHGLLADSGVERVIATGRGEPGAATAGNDDQPVSGRAQTWRLDITDDHDLGRLAQRLADIGRPPDLVIHAAGVLHDGLLQPEKSLAQCERAHLMRSFEVNSLGPLLVARAVAPLLDRKRAFTFVGLSAMVGSIGDNRLGGWYGYRASKAALNQFIRTLANEWAGRLPRAIALALHPGTTDTALSRPFQSGVSPDKLYSPDRSATRILRVIDGLRQNDSGRFLNWDGREIPW